MVRFTHPTDCGSDSTESKDSQPLSEAKNLRNPEILCFAQDIDSPPLNWPAIETAERPHPLDEIGDDRANNQQGHRKNHVTIVAGVHVHSLM
jgi:hypothetical protein